MPKDFKKSRMYVDIGSATYMDSILKVPVAREKELGFVSRTTHEAWDKVDKAEAVGGDEALDAGDAAPSEAPDEATEATIRKRKYSRRGSALARQPSTDEVVLFPHDLAGALMKELVYETNASWVLNGTPALGSGIFGCLELHVPSIVIVKSAMHRQQLTRCLKERLMSELPVTGATLACCDLVKRAETLGMTKPAAKKKPRTNPVPDPSILTDSDGQVDELESTCSVDAESKGQEKEKDKKKSKKSKKDKKKKSKK